MAQPLVDHLPSELAAGRYPAGPLAGAEVRYWRSGDGKLHGNAFCPRLQRDPAGEAQVLLGLLDPFDFCARCCDRLPEPGPPSYASLQAYVDTARGVADDAEELDALARGDEPPHRDEVRPRSLGAWGRLALLSARAASLDRRRAVIPEPLDSWARAVVAQAEGAAAGLRAELLASLPTKGCDPLLAALAAGAAGIDPAGRRWRGRVPAHLAAAWLDEVGCRLRSPAEATDAIVARHQVDGVERLRGRAQVWEARLGRVAGTARRRRPRVVACRLDPAAGSAGGPTLIVQAVLARWGVPVRVERPSRLAVVPALVAEWAAAADHVGWLFDLGPAHPVDTPERLLDAAALWEPATGRAGAGTALALARGAAC